MNRINTNDITSETDSEVETKTRSDVVTPKSIPKIVILSDESLPPIMVRPTACLNTELRNQKLHFKKASTKTRQVVETKLKKTIHKLDKPAKARKTIEKPRKNKKTVGRKPLPSSTSIFEKTCTFVPKTAITSSFTTKAVNTSTDEISELETGSLKIAVTLQSSPKVELVENYENKQIASEGSLLQFENPHVVIPTIHVLPETEVTRSIQHFQEVAPKDSQLTSTILKEIGSLKLQHSEMMSEMRKGFGKLRKPQDNFLAYIKQSLLCKSPEAFDALDNELTNDRDFYLTVKRYMRNYRGNPDNTNYYGSVLSKIVTDEVLVHYNFEGVKGKYKLEGHAVVDLLFDVYKETDRIRFENKLRDTMRFAKNRYHNLKSRQKKLMLNAEKAKNDRNSF